MTKGKKPREKTKLDWIPKFHKEDFLGVRSTVVKKAECKASVITIT